MTRILLVEDNEMNRDMLSRRLERKGHRVLLAVDGGQGVDRRGHARGRGGPIKPRAQNAKPCQRTVPGHVRVYGSWPGEHPSLRRPRRTI